LVAMLDIGQMYVGVHERIAMSFGIVPHTNCVLARNRLKVAVPFTSSKGKIVLKLEAKANIASILTLRTDI